MDEGLIPTYLPAEQIFVGGRGAVVTDEHGNDYLDFLAGIGVNALGHAHPAVTAALRDQADKLLHVSNLFRHPYTEPLATRLCRATGMDATFFTNSGAESIECAMKIARKVMHLRGTPERTSFVAIEGGFHGRTLGSLSLTHAERYRAPFGPLFEVSWVPPEDFEALAAAVEGQRPAAVFVEPIQGEGGLRELSPDFLRRAREVCDATGTVLVHDEIQSGCGRTGTFLAGQPSGATPDVVTLAKPLGGGVPMGACLARGDCATALQPGDHGSTFGGGPLACRLALVFLGALDGGLLDHARERGEELRAGLEALVDELDLAVEVRGRGLMLGLRLARPEVASAAQQELYARGLICNCTAGDVLRMLPPLVVTSEQIGRALQTLGTVLRELDHKEAP